jgi:hypothetical protein
VFVPLLFERLVNGADNSLHPKVSGLSGVRYRDENLQRTFSEQNRNDLEVCNILSKSGLIIEANHFFSLVVLYCLKPCGFDSSRR